ncbi:hypothetical protein D9758_016628 [Tetrapyrgos nigripes]|uniref:Uncharacterized protein n=1 Tax=Tetrapyrgos nigripes TaxID=182062 RepID=A0A8H5FCU0_9AGAR|nr:hypothetical protein D9758_016628 [Tetrapyrgos nigripes]
MNPLLRLLIEQSSRWRTARIHDLVEETYPTLANGKSFPLLETLEIHGVDFDVTVDLHLFNAAPRLHSLVINKLPSRQELESFTPRSQITSLEVSGSDSVSIFEALEGFSNLESVICAKVDHSLLPDNEEIRHQTLPHVHTVEIELGDFEAEQRSHTHNFLKLLIDNITLPSLTTLTIANMSSLPELKMFKGAWPHQSFSDLFQRSGPGCSLLALHLDDISLPDKDLVALLGLSPYLTELRVKELRRVEYNFTGYPFQFQDVISPLFLTSLHAYDHGSSPLVPSWRAWISPQTVIFSTTKYFGKWSCRDGFQRKSMHRLLG